MREPSRVRVTGPLEPFAEGFLGSSGDRNTVLNTGFAGGRPRRLLGCASLA